MISRVLSKGLCSYRELVDGSLSLHDFYGMMRVADWMDYQQAYAEDHARND